jgi:hypothetical protein
MSTARGISGLVLLPAKEYEWELKGRHVIEVPNSGKITEFLQNNELEAGTSIPGDDDFNIFSDDVFQLWELVRVLFANAQYPALEEGECFNVVALERDENVIRIHGEIIKSVGNIIKSVGV